jgi:hypothetical protein
MSDRPDAPVADALSGFGPFFAVRAAEPDAATTGWRPLSALLDDPAAVSRRVDAGRTALAAARGVTSSQVPRRVAASAVHLGLCARLLSPALGMALLGVPRVPTADELLWRDEPGSTFPLALPPGCLRGVGAAEPARWAADVVAYLVLPVHDAFAAQCPSVHVRLGNVAAGVHGALAVLRRALPQESGADGPPARLAAALLAHPVLRDASSGVPGRATFRRRSCCLLYRTTGRATPGALCGDCVLR